MSRNIFYSESAVELVSKSTNLVQTAVDQFFPAIKSRIGDEPLKVTLGTLLKLNTCVLCLFSSDAPPVVSVEAKTEVPAEDGPKERPPVPELIALLEAQWREKRAKRVRR